MVKTAARLWSIPENEIENSFDPLVLLLMEACAAEIEKIGFEIDQTRSSLLVKFTELMVPQSILNIKPASCIALATPLENTATLDQNTDFICSQNIQIKNKPVSKSFHFTPIGKFIIHKAKPVCLFIGNKIFKIKESGTKSIYHSLTQTKSDHFKEIFLALDTNVESLKGMHIYFDLLNHPRPESFYNALSNTKIFCNNSVISSKEGYFLNEQFDYDIENILSKGIDYTTKMNKQIANIYSRKFIHIVEQDKALNKIIPDEIKNKFSPEVLQNAGINDCVFLKIQFAGYFSEDELEGLNCFINAFPVINKEKCTQNYVTEKWVNIIPLQSENYFLDLKNIQSTDNNKYTYRVSSDFLNDGYATVRNSNISKPDSRIIRNKISGLINAMQNESSFFSELNNDFVLSRFKDISRILSRIEDQLVKSLDMKRSSTYILLKPKNEGERISIDYYTTNAEDAHAIMPYSSLTPAGHLLTGMKDNFIISKVVGGKSSYSDHDRQTLLKQQLFSKDKIISSQDIKLLCRQLLMDKLTNVEIKKGYEIGTTPQSGLNRTIDIALILKNISNEAAEYYKNEILFCLKAKASYVYPFRILLQIE